MVSSGEELLAFQLRAHGFQFEREVRFHKTRLWRFDFVLNIHGSLLAIEVEGISPNIGRHQRYKGFQNDCLKYVEGLLCGYDIMRLTTAMVKDGSAIRFLNRYAEMKKKTLDKEDSVC